MGIYLLNFPKKRGRGDKRRRESWKKDGTFVDASKIPHFYCRKINLSVIAGITREDGSRKREKNKKREGRRKKRERNQKEPESETKIKKALPASARIFFHGPRVLHSEKKGGGMTGTRLKKENPKGGRRTVYKGKVGSLRGKVGISKKTA